MAADSMTFQCIDCLHTPTDAVETDCCGQIFCEICIDQLPKNCKYCRKRKVTYHANWFIRRTIEPPTTECPNKCGVRVQASDVRGHLRWCENSEYSCPDLQCEFKGQRSEFADHLTSYHVKELVVEATRLFNEVKINSKAIPCKEEVQLPFSSDPKFDPSVSKVTNDVAKLSKLGENGKHYCGFRMKCPVINVRGSHVTVITHHVQCTCICCKRKTFVCGPVDGCNCKSCMRLDIESRGLPKGWLVNCAGASTKYSHVDGKVGWFTCGRLSEAKHGSANSGYYCGSAQGQSCLDCQYLTQHVISGLYQVILGISVPCVR